MKTRDLSTSNLSSSIVFLKRTFALRISLAVSLWIVAFMPAVATQTPPAPEPAAPRTPRDFFNAGARQLREGKLREAEAFFESTLASQKPSLQPPALYNLGHVRFGQGVEELKKGPGARGSAARAQSAEQSADEAIRNADDALAGDDLEKLVA